MRGSERHAFSLILKIVGALAVFFTLDTLIFRMPLYSQLVSPDSMVGSAAYYLKYERQREPSHRRDVLVIGDSEIGEGFWAGLANKNEVNRDFYFIQGGIPGATLRVLYFYQKILDPNRDRYKAIVICLPTYRQKSSTEAERLDDRMLDADFLVPIISSREYFEFARSFTTEENRMEVRLKVLVQGENYRMDFQNFLLHPFARLHLVSWRRKIRENVALDYAGRDENMVGLSYDSKTGDIHYPDRLTDSERAQVASYIRTPSIVDADHFDEYTKQWIERFIERYRGSQTTLVFVRFPAEVLPQLDTVRRTGPFASYMPLLRNSPGVKVMDEGAFYPLEDPQYFFDTLHLNHDGRVRFTNQLSGWLVQAL
jgi:hypothetical protein